MLALENAKHHVLRLWLKIAVPLSFLTAKLFQIYSMPQTRKRKWLFNKQGILKYKHNLWNSYQFIFFNSELTKLRRSFSAQAFFRHCFNYSHKSQASFARFEKCQINCYCFSDVTFLSQIQNRKNDIVSQQRLDFNIYETIPRYKKFTLI